MANELSLVGKSALVTGASSGIGRATSIALANQGANVSLVARSKKKLEELARKNNSTTDGTTIPVPTDVTDVNQIREAINHTTERFGGLDILVINAGIGKPGDIEDLTIESYEELMSVNVHGAFYTTKLSVKHLREANGNIVFIGSYAGMFPYPNNPVYAASKWWLRGFALSLAGSLGDQGVGVSVINPSEVRTKFGADYDVAYEEQFDKGEVTAPEDVADSVLFAVQQKPPNSITELNLFREDKLNEFSDIGSM